MSKKILKYTIRTHKKDKNLIEIFVRDYPTYICQFTTFSVNEGHSMATCGYYSRKTRPATNEEISKADSNVINNFLSLYGDDYELQYLKRLPR